MADGATKMRGGSPRCRDASPFRDTYNRGRDMARSSGFAAGAPRPPGGDVMAQTMPYGQPARRPRRGRPREASEASEAEPDDQQEGKLAGGTKLKALVSLDKTSKDGGFNIHQNTVVRSMASGMDRVAVKLEFVRERGNFARQAVQPIEEKFMRRQRGERIVNVAAVRSHYANAQNAQRSASPSSSKSPSRSPARSPERSGMTTMTSIDGGASTLRHREGSAWLSRGSAWHSGSGTATTLGAATAHERSLQRAQRMQQAVTFVREFDLARRVDQFEAMKRRHERRDMCAKARPWLLVLTASTVFGSFRKAVMAYRLMLRLAREEKEHPDTAGLVRRSSGGSASARTPRRGSSHSFSRDLTARQYEVIARHVRL